MPEKYAERPPTVEAVQFVGTGDSAMDINNWLSNYGSSVMYDSMRNRLIIQLAGDGFITAENSDWILQKPDLSISIIKNADFQLKYEHELTEPDGV